MVLYKIIMMVNTEPSTMVRRIRIPVSKVSEKNRHMIMDPVSDAAMRVLSISRNVVPDSLLKSCMVIPIMARNE